MKEDLLFKKVYGSLIGAAIGDAMGGPVEFWDRKDISRVYGRVSGLLEYKHTITDIHGPWTLHAGSYTDDSRMSKLLCKAVIDAGGPPSTADVSKVFADYYYNAPGEMAKGFIEEYFYKAIYGVEKQIFGGHPTNAGVMGIAPLGVVSPCDPVKALADAFSAVFFVEGYARYSAAICAAAISSAMRLDADPESVVKDSLDAVASHKILREGVIWRSHGMYEGIGMKNENLIREVCKLAERHKANAEISDISDIYDELDIILGHQFGADGAESMAIGFAMFMAAGGDFVKTVEGCVNFGRDNDSSASFGGALAGAFCGTDCIPPDWIATVESADPGPSFCDLAMEICSIIRSRHEAHREVADNLQMLIR